MFSLCKPISSRKRFQPHRRLDARFTFTLYDRAAAIPAEDWDHVTKGKTVFLERDYLTVTESCSHARLYPRYVQVYADGEPFAVFYFQVTDFKAGVFGDLLSGQVERLRSRRLKLFEKYIGSNKDEVLMRLFTCGNNLVSGAYGFRVLSSEQEVQTRLLLELTTLLSREEKLRGSISAVLIKDFEAKLQPEEWLLREKFSDCVVEPNMVIGFPKNLHTLDDYLSRFSKKYRNRARNIIKAGAGLELRDLSAESISALEQEMFSLYESVYERAKFKLLKLPGDYFAKVKRIFPETFFVNGLFHESRLVAFTSFFLMDDRSLEAHYIGLDYQLNNTFELYQNILYLNIRRAIEYKCHSVNLGRTAAEIKTTVGARAVDLYCYIRPQNAISRIVMGPFMQFLQPSDWTPRNPFRESGHDGPEEKEQTS